VDDLFLRYGGLYRIFVTTAGMTASFVMVISSSIVNVSIPDVMCVFGIGQDQAQLMATAFNVAMVTSHLPNAWVSNYTTGYYQTAMVAGASFVH